MATARWATAQQATTTMMIATSKDDDDDDGNGATGNEVDDDGDGVTGNGATGYNDIDDDGLALLATKFTIMAKVRWAMTTTMATAQRDTTIKSRQWQWRVATIVIGVQRWIATTTRTMTTAPARIARRALGDVDDHNDTDAAVFAGAAETTMTTSTTMRRRVK